MMMNPDDFRKNHLRDHDLFKPEDHDEIELAYLLQHFTPEDTGTIEQVVNLNSPEIYKWIAIQLYLQGDNIHDKKKIVDLMRLVFLKAFAHVNELNGYASIREWLFTLSHKVLKYKGNGYFLKKMLGVSATRHQVFIYAEQGDEQWLSMDKMAQKLRLPVVLRYIYGMPVQEIARVLGIQTRQAQSRFFKARKVFIPDQPESHMSEKIQAYLDGGLDDNPSELEALESHMSKCELCKNYAHAIKINDHENAKRLKNAWAFSFLGTLDQGWLISSIKNQLTQTSYPGKVGFSVGKIAWFVSMAITFVGLAIIFIRLTPVEREFPRNEIQSVPGLPETLLIDPATRSFSHVKSEAIYPSVVAPSFSEDGNWVVYSKVLLDPNYEMAYLQTLELFDRVSNTTQTIQPLNTYIERPWTWWDLAPSISGDGQWIAYVSTINVPGSGVVACIPTGSNHCLGIYLYERDTDEVTLITKGTDGISPDGDSLSPTLSQDGEWIAFWSAATNLVGDEGDGCGNESEVFPCMQVYIYNLKTGSMERLPIGTTIGGNGLALDRISLSADGRFVGYNIVGYRASEESQPSNTSQLTFEILGKTVTKTLWQRFHDHSEYTSEAIVYDRHTGEIEMENQAPDGTPGNGSSSSPVLSADGRYVAFVSNSTNLVENDTLGHRDVFIRDRETGMIEQVSVSSSGEPAQADSGFIYWRRGFYTLDISSDGRFVVFASAATNLDGETQSACKQWLYECMHLFIHDRQSKQTEMVNEVNNAEFSRYANISSDGRWISFMQSKYGCALTQDLCSDVMLYDRQNGWMVNLTQYGDGSADQPWIYLSSLQLPWDLWESHDLSFSPDGKMLAVGGTDSKVKIWNIDDPLGALNGREPDLILDSNLDETFIKLTFSPDGEWLAAGTTNGNVHIWSLPAGNLLYTMPNSTSPIKDLVFSRDNPYLVISTVSETVIWQISNGQFSQGNIFTHGQAVAVSHCGSLHASWQSDRTVWLRRLPEGDVIARLGGNYADAVDIAFSGDGGLLAVRLEGGTVNLWEVRNTRSNRSFITPVNSFRGMGISGAMKFSPDDEFIASPGSDGEIMLWNIPEGVRHDIAYPIPYMDVRSVAFSKESNILAAVVGNELMLFDFYSTATSRFYLNSALDTISDPQKLHIDGVREIFDFPHSDDSAWGNSVELDQEVAELDFTPLVPTHLPEFLNFKGSMVVDGSLWLRFDATPTSGANITLYIYEKFIGNSPAPKMIVGSTVEIMPAKIETMNGQTFAEYVQGDWLWKGIYIPYEYNSLVENVKVEWQWDKTSSSQRLRWLQDGIFVGIYYQSTPPDSLILPRPEENYKLYPTQEIINRADLVQIASSMNWVTDVPRSSTDIENFMIR